MITTVTTTTTTLTTASFALIAILTLMILLINKQLISGSTSATARQFSRGLNIVIVPLFIVFVVTVTVRVVAILQ